MPYSGGFTGASPFVVSIGGHSSAAEGTCLMELASVWAQEPFTASPRCVNPTLASLARIVNDHVAYETRQQLARLLPVMMTYRGPEWTVDWAVVVACLEFAHEAEGTRRSARQLRRAQRRLETMRAPGSSWLDRLRDGRMRFTANLVVLRTSWLASRHGEAALVALLTSAVAAFAVAQALGHEGAEALGQESVERSVDVGADVLAADVNGCEALLQEDLHALGVVGD